MAGVTHKFVTGKSDGGDATLVKPSNWNDTHAIAWSTASLSMTDPLTRFTVSDAGATSASAVLLAINRPDTTDSNDIYGWTYVANVIFTAAGSFDVLVSALYWGMSDPEDVQPNENITLVYALG